MNMGQLFLLYILVCIKAGWGVAWYDWTLLGALIGAAYWKYRAFKKSHSFAMQKMNEAVADLEELSKKKIKDEDADKETDPFESITT